MRNLSVAAIVEKNKLATDSVWLILLEITVSSSLTLRIANNTEDVDWDGETWTAFPFVIDDINESSKGEVPSFNIKVGNASRAIQGYLEEANGGVGSEVRIIVVNTNNLASSTPEIEQYYTALETTADAFWITFKLGASNPFNKRFPLERMFKNSCRFKFKSDRCGYSGSETSCDKTLTRCRALENNTRFGGFPGIGKGGSYI